MASPAVRQGLAATAIAVVALATLAGLLVAGALTAIDQYAVDHWMPVLGPLDDHSAAISRQQFYPSLGSPLDAFCNVWTFPGSAFVSALVLALCCVVLVRRGRGSAALAWAVAWFGANAVEVLGKHVLQRPTLHVGSGDRRVPLSVFDNAFPSGHALRAVLIAALVAAVWRRAAWPALLWIAVALPALVLSAAHTPSDVAGGALMGLAVVLAVNTWLQARVPVGYGNTLRFGLRSALAEDP